MLGPKHQEEPAMRDFELEPGIRPAPRVRDPNAAGAAGPTHAPGTGRPGAGDAAALMHLQRTAGNAGVVQMLAEDAAEDASPVHDVVGRGGGTPLDESTRSTMEAKLGADLGDVRVHTDAKASASAESVGANAYTVGSEIAFRSGQFNPTSPTGQRTLAHELAHVVQQRSGPVDGTEAPGGIRLSDPSDKFEQAADATASQVMSMPAPAPAATAAPTAQLEAEEGDPAVQPILQRQELPEEEELAQ
jgi:hypothetical protein